MNVVQNARLLQAAVVRRREMLAAFLPQSGHADNLAEATCRPGTQANALMKAICFVIAEELTAAMHGGQNENTQA